MGNDDSLKKLQVTVREFCDERDWDQFHNPKDMALSLTLEAAEVLEHFQWMSETEVEDYLNRHKGAVADELADVLYWVLRMSDKLNIDLKEAFDKKLAKNEGKYPVSKARGNHKKYTEHTK